MKKILIFISTAILSVSLLCVSVFAANSNTVPLKDVLSLGYCSIYQLSSEDYDRYTDKENNTIGVVASDGYQGTKEYQAFYVTLYYEGPDIKPYETVQFTLNFSMTGDLPHPFTFAKVFIRDDTKSQWDFVGQEIVGDVKFLGNDGSIYRCGTTISYTNKTKNTIVGGNGAEGLTFVLGFKSSQPTTFYEQIQFFQPEVLNFYLGDTSSPNYPSYSNPEDEYGDAVEDYKGKEEAVLGETEEGKEIFSNSMTWIFDALNYFIEPLSAIGRAFDFVLTELFWLHYLVRFSLAIGLVAYVLNIGASVFRSISRKKGGED